MFTKLGTRLTIIFIGLAVVPLIVVAVVFSVQTFNALVAQSLNNQRQITEQFQVAISDAISESVNELQLLNKAYGFEQFTADQQQATISGLLSNRQTYEQIAVVNVDGTERLRVSRSGIFTGADLGNRASDSLFQAVLTRSEVQYSDVHFDPKSGEPLLTIAMPFFDLRTGKVSSVIMADYRFRLIWNLVADLEAKPGNKDSGVTIFVSDAVGEVVAHANPSIVLRNTVYHLPAADGQAPGLDGEASVINRQDLQIGNIQFVVVGQKHLVDALQPAFVTLSSIGVVSIVALIAAALLVAAVVRQIVFPIEILSRASQAIQRGDLDARANVVSRDEIGILARSFNDMAGRLKDFIQTLEARVNERVRDLNLAAEVSRQATTQLDTGKLLADVAELTVSAFTLYHVSIFLFDEDLQLLRLRQGTGQIGQRLLKTDVTFRLDSQGIVAAAAQKQGVVLSNDVLRDATYSPNDLLTNTRSELAVAMLYQGRLIGVLDLQSEKADRFQEQDVRLMKTLADQIAIAVRNAQLFESSQLALQTAERANRVKSAFLASMSHELRTPLNAVINYSQFVVDGDVGPINDEQRELLNEVINSGIHLLNLINDVLDMSKIESGSMALFIEDSVDLGEILKKVEATARGLLLKKPVALHLDVDPDIPNLRGDRQRIYQIMLNIVSNACKFTPEGSIAMHAYLDKDQVLVKISDTGPGISLADQPAVFEAFKQTESGTRQGGGTGLGMPISRSLAEAHGGHLWLESQLGKGSTFYVSLPIKSEIMTPKPQEV